MNLRVSLKIIALIVFIPILALTSLVALNKFEYKRIKEMCFSIKIGDSYPEAMVKISEYNFVDPVEWTGDILKRLEIEGGLTHIESLLVDRTISCSIEHKDNVVVDVSSGSHFGAWLRDGAWFSE
ncbi:hypothetical protein [Bacterioplanoides sp. SCSIO 12839]|uniref:hypothetical protein n=1 Tax=Bacterioplanoides sp. SCSIO 12839 TaxID=2829569 RepID=UPI002102BD23|nr:hypothetical protein [Bacterioplanoides sp. SCSIO 12839]UTW49271.1 hypothetical protein KFF03_05035 [Bacterioplanoides sp. SCSIO 12839]